MAEETTVQEEAMEETKRAEETPEKQDRPAQKLRRRGEDDDVKAAKSRHLEDGVVTEGVGPGRKSKACLECKKLKMKCEVTAGEHKCKHCVRRQAECIFRTTRIVRIDEANDVAVPDRKTLDLMREEMKLMRESLNVLLAERKPPEASPAMGAGAGADAGPGQQSVGQQSAGQPQSATQASAPLAIPTGTPCSSTSPAGLSSIREDNTQMAMTRENSLEPEQEGGGGVLSSAAVTVEEPMGSLYEVTRLRNIRSNKAKTARPLPGSQGELNDFIARGTIPEGEAEALYRRFTQTLNHYLWVGLEQTHSSFQSVRQSSELLTATILAVTALHIPTSAETFDTCYREFLALISSSMFSRYHSIDDVRGLCIAAFWLSDVSWKLSGHAIRIATELNIHQSFAKALEGDREHFQRARLWYMLYVCDHHFSIAYGRPPMIAESIQIREHELFLSSPLADAIDARILSQVALMQILTRVYERFGERRLPERHVIRTGGGGLSASATASASASGAGGDHSASMLSEEDFVDVRSFNLEIEQWRMCWYARQRANSFIGTFPPKGIILYSYFAKLQLNILAVRGVSLSTGRMSTERKELTNMAISAAASILTFVLEEGDMRRALVGTPLYVHMMIAFASAFLMKVATRWNRIMGFNIEHSHASVSRLLDKTIDLLKSCVTSDRHVLHHIAAGLEKMLARMTAEYQEDEQRYQQLQELQQQQQQQQQHNPHQNQQSHMHQDMDPLFPHHHRDYDTPLISYGFGAAVQGAQLVTPGGWEQQGSVVFGEGPTLMSDSMLYEAFGADAPNDMYNLLTSQFV